MPIPPTWTLVREPRYSEVLGMIQQPEQFTDYLADDETIQGNYIPYFDPIGGVLIHYLHVPGCLIYTLPDPPVEA